MWDGSDHLNRFYQTQCGAHVQKTLAPLTERFCTAESNTHNAAFGYPFPFLPSPAPYQESAHSPRRRTGHILPLVPDWVGPDGLPPAAVSGATLIEPYRWPLQDVQLDRLMLAHALEFDARPDLILAESWRVLDGSGKLLVMVAHRHGLWTQAERTPFGQGQPFSRRQLRAVLAAAGFEVTALHCVVHAPPAAFRWMTGLVPTLEAVGRRLWPMLGGVLVAEADKMLYAPAGNTSRLRRSSGMQPARLAPQTGRSFNAPCVD